MSDDRYTAEEVAPHLQRLREAAQRLEAGELRALILVAVGIDGRGRSGLLGREVELMALLGQIATQEGFENVMPRALVYAHGPEKALALMLHAIVTFHALAAEAASAAATDGEKPN